MSGAEMVQVYKTMLIDDEPFIRDDLRYLLSRYSQIEVVWETGVFREALKIIGENRLDLVFLDIRIRGGNGFDLIPFINPQETEFIVITAHEKYLKQAKQMSRVPALLKPVSPDRLGQALHKMFNGRLSSHGS